MNQYVDFPETLPDLLFLLIESLFPILVSFFSVEEMVKGVALRIVFHTLLTPATFTFSELPSKLPCPEAEVAFVAAAWTQVREFFLESLNASLHGRDDLQLGF